MVYDCPLLTVRKLIHPFHQISHFSSSYFLLLSAFEMQFCPFFEVFCFDFVFVLSFFECHSHLITPHPHLQLRQSFIFIFFFILFTFLIFVGLIFSSGDTWKEQRKFSLSILRSFGVGKRSFENEIATESKYLIQELHSMNGKAINPAHLFGNAVANVICSVTFGRRCNYEDKDFKQMLELVELILQHEIGVALVTTQFPILVRMPFGPIRTFRNYLLEYRQCIRNVIEEHQATFNNENLRDFIDVYFQQIYLKKEQGIDTKLNEDNMEATLEDLFLGGSETSANTLKWSILLMISYPNVQSRVQRELDDVVGRSRLPILADRPSLPYTEATIQEIMRYGSIAPLGAPHYTHVDTTFRGYKIPEGTVVLGNLWSISRDPTLWNDDDIGMFNPERFLDANCNTIRKPEHHIVFGSGKLCSLVFKYNIGVKIQFLVMFLHRQSIVVFFAVSSSRSSFCSCSCSCGCSCSYSPCSFSCSSSS